MSNIQSFFSLIDSIMNTMWDMLFHLDFFFFDFSFGDLLVGLMIIEVALVVFRYFTHRKKDDG